MHNRWETSGKINAGATNKLVQPGYMAQGRER